MGFQGLGFNSGFASDFLDDPGQKVSAFLPWMFCILFSKRFMYYLPPLLTQSILSFAHGKEYFLGDGFLR